MVWQGRPSNLKGQNMGSRNVECTDGVSDDKNRILELLRAVRGKLLNRTDGPSIRIVPEDIIVKTYC